MDKILCCPNEILSCCNNLIMNKMISCANKILSRRTTYKVVGTTSKIKLACPFPGSVLNIFEKIYLTEKESIFCQQVHVHISFNAEVCTV